MIELNFFKFGNWPHINMKALHTWPVELVRMQPRAFCKMLGVEPKKFRLVVACRTLGNQTMTLEVEVQLQNCENTGIYTKKVKILVDKNFKCQLRIEI